MMLPDKVRHISFTTWTTGVISMLTIISMIFGGWLFLKSEFADAGTLRSFRAEHVESEISANEREIRQLSREMRRVPESERQYYKEDIDDLNKKIELLRSRKQNILEDLE